MNVHPTGGYLNDMFMDYDNVARGYEHARYMIRLENGPEYFDMKLSGIAIGDLLV